ncbi:MAG: PepSY domain-containing protein [Pseudolabrys sp.]
MPGLRLFSFAIALAAGFTLAGAPAFAADLHLACLGKEAQREAVAAGKAVPLAQAITTVRPRAKSDKVKSEKAKSEVAKSEVVRARLCHGPHGLVYVLTLLSRNGKVTSATVDAANGNVVGGG